MLNVYVVSFTNRAAVFFVQHNVDAPEYLDYPNFLCQKSVYC